MKYMGTEIDVSLPEFINGAKEQMWVRMYLAAEN